MSARRFGALRPVGVLTENLTTAAYLAGWRLVRLLPERVALAVFGRIADLIHGRDGAGVRRLRSNLARVRPELDAEQLDALTRRGVRSYLRYWCESFRLPSWPMPDLVRRTRIADEARLRSAYERGDGLVVPLPHMANWDWAGAWACANGMPLVTVAERLKPEKLYDRFVDYRTSLGMEILPLTGGEAATPRLERALRAGGLVCLLADRDLSRTSVEVSLCGQPAQLPRGPAVLARRTGAALIPATLHYDGPDLVVTLGPEIEHQDGEAGIVAMTQAIADAFTDGFRAHPEDWHMMQKVFGADLARRDRPARTPPAGQGAG